MKVLIISATGFEVQPFRAYLGESNFISQDANHFVKGELEIYLLVTGVGLPLTAFSLGKMLSKERFDLAIQVGIAGAFNRQLKIGTVVQVVSERFGDLGVEEADGSFTDVHKMELIGKDDPPFKNGEL